jgi:hypothetical protein
LVERIRITSSNITTKDASGNITFDTDRLYLKTDSGGSLKAGGYQKVPTMSGGYSSLVPITNTDLGMFCPNTISLQTITSSTSFNYPISRYSVIRAGDNTYNNGYSSYDPTSDREGFKSAQISLYTSAGEYIGYYNWVATYLYVGQTLTEDTYDPSRWAFQGLAIANLNISNFNFTGIPNFTFTNPATWYSTAENSTISELNPQPTDLYLDNFYIMTTSEPTSLSLRITP